jgi:hypothetical protein
VALRDPHDDPIALDHRRLNRARHSNERLTGVWSLRFKQQANESRQVRSCLPLGRSRTCDELCAVSPCRGGALSTGTPAQLRSPRWMASRMLTSSGRLPASHVQRRPGPLSATGRNDASSRSELSLVGSAGRNPANGSSLRSSLGGCRQARRTSSRRVHQVGPQCRPVP